MNDDNRMHLNEHKPKERYAIGTQAVLTYGDNDYSVVCATCDNNSDKTQHTRKDEAFYQAIRNSNKACRVCGER